MNFQKFDLEFDLYADAAKYLFLVGGVELKCELAAMKLLKPNWVTHQGKPIFSLDVHPDGSR